MSEKFVRFIIPTTLVPGFVDLAKANQIEISEPQPIDNTGEPLNAPITGAEVIYVAHVITVTASAASALLNFTLRVAKLLQAGQKQKIDVNDVANRHLTTLKVDSTKEQIEEDLKNV